MPASKKSPKQKKRSVPKSEKVKLSDLTPKKGPKGGVGGRQTYGCGGGAG
jgi:hypothetical protein